jgi:hypothetical protein
MTDEGITTSEPQREPAPPAQDKGQTITYTAPESYEERTVAFLDILGWRELIGKSQTNPEFIQKMGAALTYLKVAHELPRSIEGWLRSRTEAEGKIFDPHEGRLQFAQFSDCILLSGERDLSFMTLFQVWSVIRSLFYNLGFLVRGAVTYGPAYHRGSVAFGPALTAAYDLERKSAIYPRVILDPAITQGFPDHLTPDSSPFASMLRRDRDGLWFFDYLRPLLSMDVGPELEQQWLDEFIRPNLLYSKQLIEEGASGNVDDSRKKDKYSWLAGYFNAVNVEYPSAKVSSTAV